MFDIIIRNGRIVDGTGNPWFPGDVAIAGDRIAAVGRLPGAQAAREIDAAGKVVCPGFIDCHSHSDQSILANRAATSSIYQGVTTEIAGQCGLSPAPITDVSRVAMARGIEGNAPGVVADWSTHAEYNDRLGQGLAINFAVLAGHTVLRRAVLGMEDRRPTEDEMRQMERLLEESLDGGAFGLSFGLEYAPGSSADAEELRRLCAVAGRRGKITAWHVRNRDRWFEASIREALDATQAAGAALQIAHLSAKPGSTPRAWNRVVEMVRLAREAGHDVEFDMIPFVAGPGLLSAILPAWATAGSNADVVARLRDPETRRRLIDDSERYWLLFHRRQWDKLTLASSRAHPEWVGLTFRQIGEVAGHDPFECVYDILADEGEGMDRVWINGVLFSEGDVAEWIAHPLCSIASDGFTAGDAGPWLKISNHPNCFGWTPLVIQKYVRELRALSLETAVAKMTGRPAARWRLLDRGLLRAGMAADVVVFDEGSFRTRATYLDPHHYAEGMEWVIVNGEVALEAGTQTPALAGRVVT